MKNKTIITSSLRWGLVVLVSLSLISCSKSTKDSSSVLPSETSLLQTSSEIAETVTITESTTVETTEAPTVTTTSEVIETTAESATETTTEATTKTTTSSTTVKETTEKPTTTTMAVPTTTTEVPTTIMTEKPTTTTTEATTTTTAESLETKPTSLGDNSGSFNSDMAKEVLTLVNQKRQENGLAPLSWNKTLVKAADIRATEIVISFSHIRPDGSEWWSAGAQTQMGENLAFGQTSATEVVEDWMKSSTHRGNILSGSYSVIGISCYYCNSSYYWAQEFA